ncbi:MAG: hypothetical protein ACTSRP_13225 [Candidatus Helarchaeota archaeon]
MGKFREFCVFLNDPNNQKLSKGDKIELFFSFFNRVYNYETKELYLNDFISPLFETLNYFYNLKKNINELDKWIKYFIFKNEDFEIPVDDQIIQVIKSLKDKLEINELRSIFKANYSIEKRKEEIYRVYEKFITQIREFHAEYLSVFLNVFNLQDFKTLLKLIREFYYSMKNHFKTKLKEKKKQYLFNCYRILITNILESNNNVIILEQLERLKNHKDDLDHLNIYIDFSKKDKIRIFLDLTIINKQYYPIINLDLMPIGMFRFQTNRIYPRITSKNLIQDINNYLRTIAEMNKLKFERI